MGSQHRAEELNAACDACRARKIKCPGQMPLCQRCAEDGVHCHYSTRKRMGRPRKKKCAAQSGQDERHVPGTSTSPESSQPSPYHATVGHSPPALTHDHAPQTTTGPFSQSQASTHHSNETPSLDGADSASAPLPVSVSRDMAIFGTCNCIMIMTNILEQLRLLQTFSFPLSINILSSAMSATQLVIMCRFCPHGHMTALQNQNLLQAVMFSFVDRFRVLLEAVWEEANRLVELGNTKALRVGDPDAPMEMHSGTPDCPVGLVIQLDGQLWRQMSEAALKKLVYDSQLSLTALLDAWETRQRHWHADPAMVVECFKAYPDLDPSEDGTAAGGCLSIINRVRKQVQNLGL